MEIVLKKFKELSLEQLYQMLKLRAEVFVVEQNCAYQDLDGLDQEAVHVLAYADAHLVAYARILPPGLQYTEPAIGRVATSKSIRLTGKGKLLFAQTIQGVQKRYPQQNIRIMAQCYLRKFYQDFGFVPQGSEFLEDNIPHVEMLLKV